MVYKQQFLAYSKLNESFLLQKVRSAAGGFGDPVQLSFCSWCGARCSVRANLLAASLIFPSFLQMFVAAGCFD